MSKSCYHGKNNTKPCPQGKNNSSADNILEVLCSWNSTQPDKRVFSFIESEELGVVSKGTIAGGGAREVELLTYSDVFVRAKTVAYKLLHFWNVQPRDRVILAFPPGLDFLCAFLGCLWAGAIAVPIAAPRPTDLPKDLPSLRRIVNDCDAKVALTTRRYLILLRFYGIFFSLKRCCFRSESVDDISLQWHPAGDMDMGGGCDSIQIPDVSPGEPAFIQYTSGSTSSPKGVVITHKNLMHNLFTIVTALNASRSTVVVSWLPQFHDMGLIGSCLALLFCGGSGYYISPMSFIKDPLLWLRLVSHYRGTHLQGPNFCFALCVKRAQSWERRHRDTLPGLDLSSVVHVFNAAEQVRKETIKDFYEVFKKYGFTPAAMSPGYGLAEHTVYVCDGGNEIFLDTECLEKEGFVKRGETALMGCGFPPCSSGITIKIVQITEDDFKECPDGVVGEVWVSSDSASSNYWGNPEESSRLLCAQLPSTTCKFIRTGDLGFIFEKQLFITGRMKDTIVVRGRNHSPQDIEYTAQQMCEAFRPGCIVAAPISKADGDEGLMVIAELRENVSKEILRRNVSSLMSAIPKQHGISCYEIVLLRKGSLPKTTSGKLRRSRAKEMLARGEFEPVYCKIGLQSAKNNHGAQPLEENFPDDYLSELKALSADGKERSLIDKIKVFVYNTCGAKNLIKDESILDAGGDSLCLVHLHRHIAALTGIDVPVSLFFDNSSPRGIAAVILTEFEIQHPVCHGAQEYHCSSSVANSANGNEGVLTRFAFQFRGKLVWLFLFAVLYNSYVAMAKRKWNWWEQPKEIFEGEGIELGYFGRYRDMYHQGLLQFYLKIFPLLSIFLVAQTTFRVCFEMIFQCIPAPPFHIIYIRFILYACTGFVFVYCIYGSGLLWFSFSVIVNYLLFCMVRCHPYRVSLFWIFGILYLMLFNLFCYRVRSEDRSYENIIMPLFPTVFENNWMRTFLQWIDRFEAPIRAVGVTDFYCRYLLLRLLSFNLDACRDRRSARATLRSKDVLEDIHSSVFAYLAYVFYFPLILRGPSLSYGSFIEQIVSQDMAKEHGRFVSHEILLRLFCELMKLAFYVFLLEIAVHTFYYPTLIFTEIDRFLNIWEWTGYYCAYLSFMYVQGVITYGIPRILAAMDGINAPNDMPRCFFTASTSFRSHWRCYHASWNKWFLQYIYLPLGGGYVALWCVCIWSFLLHPFDEYWVKWSFITTLALTVETFLKGRCDFYKNPNFIIRGLNHAIVAWVHIYIFDGTTSISARLFAYGIVVFMIVFEISADKKRATSETRLVCTCSPTLKTE